MLLFCFFVVSILFDELFIFVSFLSFRQIPFKLKQFMPLFYFPIVLIILLVSNTKATFPFPKMDAPEIISK